MSPNERELGGIDAALKQIVHKQRNLAMILEAIREDLHDQQAQISNMRTMLRTGLSVLAFTVAALAWVVEWVTR